MTDDTTPAKPPPDLKAHRDGTKITRQERYFNLMASRYTCHQIARMVRKSVATVRHEIDRALAERPLDTPERFAQVQVARVVKALRLAETAVELGELKAVATYLRVVGRSTAITSWRLGALRRLAADRPRPRRSPCLPRPRR